MIILISDIIIIYNNINKGNITWNKHPYINKGNNINMKKRISWNTYQIEAI